MQFIKYHGLGNDFVLLQRTIDDLPAISPEFAREICARGQGVGADGVMRARPSERADVEMELLNADGTTPEMCGNGIRCLVKYLVEELSYAQNPLRIWTGAGLRSCTYETDEDGRVHSVRVEMGPAVVEERTVEGISGYAVDLGNPHFVIFEQGELSHERAATVGAALTVHPAFPDGANIEFVSRTDDGSFDVIVYERGCGLTQACGTGATAVVAAAIACERGAAHEPIAVRLPGGTLTIEVAPDLSQTWMTGPATEVYRGRLG
ncbi:MAG: diaminopimelate epimerase [Deltaproteobacteria bacterium]|nr:diaminopimelate epimerase [Deltaproteobacteria bacterium]